MTAVFGFDTSNYTTSAAAFVPQTSFLTQQKKLLPVKPGEKGLRQSDAVFHHTVQLPQVFSALQEGIDARPLAVCASVSPRMEAGSYMPCFLVGKGAGELLARANGVPFFTTSHQHGHVMAALFGAQRLDLAERQFLAFHVSGGTTEALLVSPDPQEILQIRCVASSLDLKAGQAIDRVGLMLGLQFPCGAALDRLSRESDRIFRIRPTLKDGCPSLSGIENQCRKMIENGESPADVARFCILSVAAALEGMTAFLLQQYGDLPLLYAGGVMSNSEIRKRFEKQFGAVFAPPEFSCDNAAGVALIGSMKMQRNLESCHQF